MSIRPYISVVIPLFNKEDYIKDTVSSVLAQTFIDFELIIINDGSTDQSLKIISEINDQRIRIIDQKNRGVAAARNNGIKQSFCDYVAFLDADDLWERSYLMSCWNLIKKYPDAVILGHAISRENRKSLQVHNKLPHNFTDGFVDYFKVSRKVSLYSSSSVIVKKRELEIISGFNENLTHGEDLDLWMRLAVAGKTVYCTQELVNYRKDIKNSARLKAKDPNKHLISLINNYHFDVPYFNGYKHCLTAKLLKHYIARRVFYKVRKYITIHAFMKLPFKYKFYLFFSLINIKLINNDS